MRAVACTQTENDGTLPNDALNTDEEHALLEKADAKKRKYDVTQKNYCMYKFCPHASGNKKQKCGQSSAGMQEGRARAPCFCIHPACLYG